MADEGSRGTAILMDRDIFGLSSEPSKAQRSGKARSLSPFSRTLLKKKMAKNFPLWKKIIRLIFVSGLGVLVVLFTVLAHVLSPVSAPDTCVDQKSGTFLFNDRDGYFRLCHSGEERLTGHLGKNIINNQVKSVDRGGGNKFTFTTSSVIWHLALKPTGTCVRIEWSGETSYGTPFKDCFNMLEASWYGGYVTHRQFWPINNHSRVMMPFLSNITYKHPDGFGPILHPVWYSSNGVVLFVENNVPLHVSVDAESGLCLQSVPYALGCTPRAAQVGRLTYTACQFSNIVEAVKHFLQDSGEVQRPTHVPQLKLFTNPIWSTGVFLGRNISEGVTCAYLNTIITKDFQIGKFGIDCCYSDTFGELGVDSGRFSEGFSNIAEIARDKNIVLSAWVHPFVNYDFHAFESAMSEGLGIFLPGGSKETTALVEWKLGHGALVNFEMEAAKNWFRDSLNEFVKNASLGSLLFYAGESDYLPDCLYFPDSTHPATYTQKYIQFVTNYSNMTGIESEMHVGYFSQNESVFLRMVDRESSWGLENGLKSVITTALTLSLTGYNFIIPSVIGGNGSCDGNAFSASCTVTGSECSNMSFDCRSNFCNGTQMQRELYLRWLQLSAFLPVLHFSVPPWVFGPDVEMYATTLLTFHSQFVSDYIVPLLEKTVSDAMCPLIRPLWWIDPNGRDSYFVDDQFLIGNTILVAPIVDPGKQNRTVYFPPGSWMKCDTSDNRGACSEEFISESEHTRKKSITIDLIKPMIYFKLKGSLSPASQNSIDNGNSNWC